MKRRTALAGALAATLALVAWTTWQDGDDPALPTVAAVARPAVRAAGPAQDAARADRATWTEAGATALAAWQGPAPPPPAPPPPAAAPAAAEAPAPPAAPPFPYRWIGTLQDETGVRALLANEQRSLGAASGDTIDTQWRIERIAERRIDLVWLPGGQALTLAAR